MNNERILRITNCFLLICSYQLHWLDTKAHRYRLSLWATLNFCILVLFYAICINQHFESALLKVILDVSTFLWQLTRAQLIIGLVVFIFSIYEINKVTAATNGLVKVLTQLLAQRFCRAEAFGYCLLFSTCLIGMALMLYIAIEMEFELPPMDHILISFALFIPHLVLAGALRLFCVGHWLLRTELLRLAENFDSILREKTTITNVLDIEIPNYPNIEIPIESVAAIEIKPDEQREQSLRQLQMQTNNLANVQEKFNSILQIQLLLLIILNANCILAGFYSLLYFETSWHVLFSGRWKRIFYAANSGIFVLIFWDYLCLCLTYFSFTNVKNKFFENINLILKKKSQFTKDTRYILKDLHDLLLNKFTFKFLGIKYMTIWSFLMIQIFIGIAVVLTVIYQYFNDQIVSLITRLDDDIDDDE